MIPDIHILVFAFRLIDVGTDFIAVGVQDLLDQRAS